MATTWLARRHGDTPGREFVLKRVHPRYASHVEARESFLEESRVSTLLDHPNIVRALPAGTISGEPYLPMDFVWGGDLRSVHRACALSGRRLPLGFSVAVVEQVARGMAWAHRLTDEHGQPLGLVHRDISPPNIMLGFDGGVRIVDFGIVRLNPDAATVRTGQLKGKFGYMSPEQVLGLELDGRSDIFSLGIVLYELCTTRRLFRAESDFASAQQIAAADVEPPSVADPTFPPELEAIILRTLAREPGDRWPDADVLADVLRSWRLSVEDPWDTVRIGALVRELLPEAWASMREIAGPEYPGPVSVVELDLPSPDEVERQFPPGTDPTEATLFPSEPPTDADRDPVAAFMERERRQRRRTAWLAAGFVALAVLAILMWSRAGFR